MYKKIIFFILLCLFLNFCSSKEKTSLSEEKTEQDFQEMIEENASSIQLRLDEFKPSVPIQKIQRLDVPSFINLYLSFLEYQIVWLRDNYKTGGNSNINNESDESLNSDSQRFLQEQTQQKEDFFKKWGITFHDFDQFSLTNSQEIQDYIKSNPVERAQLEKLEKFLTSIQSSNLAQSDEYNFKDETSILKKATEYEENIQFE